MLRLVLPLELLEEIALEQALLELLSLLRLLLPLELLGGRGRGLDLCRANLPRQLRVLLGKVHLGLDLLCHPNLFHSHPLWIQGGNTSQMRNIRV